LKLTLNWRRQCLFSLVAIAITVLTISFLNTEYYSIIEKVSNKNINLNIGEIVLIFALASLTYILLKELYLLVFGFEIILDRKTNLVFKNSKQFGHLDEITDLAVDKRPDGEGGATFNLVISFTNKNKIKLKGIYKRELATGLQNRISEFRQKK
jgi:hypothetical protein